MVVLYAIVNQLTEIRFVVHILLQIWFFLQECHTAQNKQIDNKRIGNIEKPQN